MSLTVSACYRSPIGWIRIEVDGASLRSAAFVPKPALAPARVSAGARRWLRRLDDYFAGRPVAPGAARPRGTRFQTRVWRRLSAVPRGGKISYQELAARAGCPTAVRAVANAVGANPAAIFIPCHRVVRKNGALGGYAAGVRRKRWLLRHERARREAVR